MSVRTPIAVAGLVLLLGVALVPFAERPADPREVVLVVRQMAFHLGEDAATPNPVIRVAPGERIRITLVNMDAGVSHDLAIEAWGIHSPLLRGESRTSFLVRAPDEPGTAEYVCLPHASMMRGTIEVTAAAGDHRSSES